MNAGAHARLSAGWKTRGTVCPPSAPSIASWPVTACCRALHRAFPPRDGSNMTRRTGCGRRILRATFPSAGGAAIRSPCWTTTPVFPCAWRTVPMNSVRPCNSSLSLRPAGQDDDGQRRAVGIYHRHLVGGKGAKQQWIEYEYHNLDRFQEIGLCLDDCKHTSFSSKHFLRVPVFQPSAGIPPASGYSGIHEDARCCIHSASVP